MPAGVVLAAATAVFVALILERYAVSYLALATLGRWWRIPALLAVGF